MRHEKFKDEQLHARIRLQALSSRVSRFKMHSTTKARRECGASFLLTKKHLHGTTARLKLAPSPTLSKFFVRDENKDFLRNFIILYKNVN